MLEYVGFEVLDVTDFGCDIKTFTDTRDWRHTLVRARRKVQHGHINSTRPPAVAACGVHVQRFGTFLSNMVLPNIGAFIAWGLITALFIETGWIT